MAETHVNFLAGSPLNRLSWLRTSTPFLDTVLVNPEARWVLFKSGEPLVRMDDAKKSHSLASLSTLDVSPLLGASPVFGQGKEPGQAALLFDENDQPMSHVEAARLHGPGIVFLGLHEPEGAQVEGSKALPSHEFSAKTDPQVAGSNISGTPYFSLDVSEVEKEALDTVLKNLSEEVPESEVDGELLRVKEWRHRLQRAYLGKQPPNAEDAPGFDALFGVIEDYREMTAEKLQYSKLLKVLNYVSRLDDDKVPCNDKFKFKARAEALRQRWLPLLEESANSSTSDTPFEVSYEFMEPRTATTAFTAFEAAIFAQARSMVDWNARNKFCPSCGSPTYSLWAGWKLACSTLLPWVDNTGKKECPSAKGLNNFSHPRTDAVVIMAIIDESGDKVLLGRNRKFPDGFYSTLAGFIEPGESFEDAVKREIWEEAGVRVWGMKYHSGQPWPYPATLMVGFYAFADSSKPIRVDLDNELVDARWFTREEVQAVLAHKQGSVITRQEHKVFDNHDTDKRKGQQNTETVNAVDRQQQLNATLPFRVPPSTAIAGVLIRDWASGKIGAGGSGALRKGNL